MRVTELRTIRTEAVPNLLIVEVRTDEGIVGLGETYFGAMAVEAYLHESVAPQLRGADPLAIDKVADQLTPYLGFQSTGVELRGNSAINIALWDILGKAAGLPLFEILGGRCRSSIPVYNTCAGPGYMASGKAGTQAAWGLEVAHAGRYEDLDAFLFRAGDLAQDLLSEGIRAMKIWPLDVLADDSGGTLGAGRRLAQALEPMSRIRDAVGTDIDVMLELHSKWDLPSARQVIAAATEFSPFWIEDPLRGMGVTGLAALAREFRTPIATGETLAGVDGFHALLESGFSGVVIIDLTWAGGITTARKVAAQAAVHQLPVAIHDCTGPIALAAAVHFVMTVPNVFVQEIVRAYYHGWYGNLVTPLPRLDGGELYPPLGPGLGVELVPDLLKRPGVSVMTSTLHD